MAEHSAHSVVQVLKRKTKDLFVALADPTQSRKNATKSGGQAINISELSTSEETQVVAALPEKRIVSDSLLHDATDLRDSEPETTNVTDNTNTATTASSATGDPADEVTTTRWVSGNALDQTDLRAGGITIAPGTELAKQLQQAVLEHRSLRSLERNADLELSFLENEADRVLQRTRVLQRQVKSLGIARTNLQQEATLVALGAEITRLQDAWDDNSRRRQRLNHHILEVYQEFRSEQYALFDHLDNIFVEKKLLTAKATSSSGYSNTATGCAASCGHRSRQDASSIVETSRRMDGDSCATSKVNTDVALNDAYSAAKKRLYACEQRFDTRNDLFDGLWESRAQKLSDGRSVESATQFDLWQCEETRLMTRDLIEAEVEYDAAKMAATKAGIRLEDDDLESGFVSDMDDGYTISEENEMIEDCDRVGVELWLDGLEPGDPITCELAAADGLDEVYGEMEQDVGLSDSVSVVASGQARRKIDDWRAARS